MHEALERINSATESEAASIFRDCCGSGIWSSVMTNTRPFTSEKELLETAAAIWNDLEIVDWLEAFSAHPKIGETRSASAEQTRSAEWSAGEQAGMNLADETVKQELAKANDEYVDKFGFIFIVCATGQTAEGMLVQCRERLTNDRETEIGIAAAEQQKITEIRLRKLFSP